MKKYVAKTNVSVNVVLASGKNHHVSFSPQTGGGSVYYTDSEDLQSALEAHYKFGKLFKIDQSYVEERVRDKKGKQEFAKQAGCLDGNTGMDPGSEKKEIAGEENGEGEETESNVIVVTDPEEAKDYLCEHYGLSRTKIKGLKSIKEAAAVQGITFKWLE